MKDELKQVKNYNNQIARNLREIFTPLSDALQQQVANINKDNIQKYLDNLKLCLIDYQSSRYDINSQITPQIMQGELNNNIKNSLNESEIYYFNSFLKHLNEVAVLKPYNFSEFLTGNFTEYLWAPVSANLREANNHAADTIVVPISEYGLENSLLMLLTTTLLLRLADTLHEKGLYAEQHNWSILSVETLRGRKKAEQLAHGATEVLSTLDTLKEGIQSFQGTLSSLTAKKINQMSFGCLLEQIITEKMPQKIAVKVPFSYTLPSIRQGIFFENVFNQQTGTPDKLNFSNVFIEYCKETQELYRNSRILVDGKRNPGLLGTGCPVAQKMNGYELMGINYIGKAYLHVFNLLKENLNLEVFKELIIPLKLSPALALPQALNKADEFKIYNISPQDHAIAKAKIAEIKQLYEITDEILRFWFGSVPVNELPAHEIRERWFATTPEFDQEIHEKFSAHISAVKQNKFITCNRTPIQTLALVILLDQFSRNAYRNTSEAYASDPLAIKLSLEIIATGQDLSLEPVCRWFLYMPLQHSESIQHQDKSVALFTKLSKQAYGCEEITTFLEVLNHAKQHRDIIKHFGRFPFRNKILQRQSTPAENIYLNGLTRGAYYNNDYFYKVLSEKSIKQSNFSLDNYNKAYIVIFGFLSLGLYSQSSDNNYTAHLAGLIILMLITYAASSTKFYNNSFSFFRRPLEYTSNKIFHAPLNKTPASANVDMADTAIDIYKNII